MLVQSLFIEIIVRLTRKITKYPFDTTSPVIEILKFPFIMLQPFSILDCTNRNGYMKIGWNNFKSRYLLLCLASNIDLLHSSAQPTMYQTINSRKICTPYHKYNTRLQHARQLTVIRSHNIWSQIAILPKIK